MQALHDVEAELVCLAGFMRVLTATFVDKWQGRMINIHPSLLPSFKGLHTHEQALAAGVKIAGCTVHFVVPEMDAGPIIAQAAVPVRRRRHAPTASRRGCWRPSTGFIRTPCVCSPRVRQGLNRAVFPMG